MTLKGFMITGEQDCKRKADSMCLDVIQINGKNICPCCGSGDVICTGGVHYQKTGFGMGNEIRKIGCLCNSCGVALLGK